MRILYVEDELSQNIPRIIQLFGGSLGEKCIRILEQLENDINGYGASPEEIKQIVDSTNILELEYRFPDALRKILSRYERYDLFIIDRNLSESQYTTEEINEIDPDYSKQLEKYYTEREGDYLVFRLGICSNGEALEKVRFLTAYSNQHEFFSHQENPTQGNRWRAQIKTLVEKGDVEAIERLYRDIVNLPSSKTRGEKQS